METNKKILWWNLAILVIPLVYIAYIWNRLPETIPTHWNIDGEVDRYGNKSELLFIHTLLLFTGVGMSLLMLYLNKIDPKGGARYNQKVMEKLSVVICIFFSVIQLFVIHITHKNTFTSPKPVLVALGLLFTFIGNMINNVKPNYFLGIRTPWTLENEEVWRRTHHFGAKLWFWGGLGLSLLMILLPMIPGIITLITIILVLALWPVIYSYRLYKQLKKQ